MAKSEDFKLIGKKSSFVFIENDPQINQLINGYNKNRHSEDGPKNTH